MNQPIIIVMGVSGCGKTTVGERLAKQIGRPFYDGDDFHSAANVAKMAAGHPLTDADRHDWLATLATKIGEWERSTGAVLACSALKEAYRQTLQAGAQAPLNWVFLDGDPAVLHARLEGRHDHYMKANMLDSQLATLERPTYGLRIDINNAIENQVAQIVAQLHLPTAPAA
ncbi:AAA family ATPase [Hymenobacter sp. HMF4947]|uniref:Gluconokinase n=1 Tax=Hymenobacter ginkgonis TaxID=2682976 RepID=A0A7K1T9N5_9BACT|nr:gluconokinase [Hymenobacter ginkgonis]MVN75108.1 AAA family ATPase [Hymenobacter ginkgonis]